MHSCSEHSGYAYASKLSPVLCLVTDAIAISLTPTGLLYADVPVKNFSLVHQQRQWEAKNLRNLCSQQHCGWKSELQQSICA